MIVIPTSGRMKNHDIKYKGYYKFIALKQLFFLLMVVAKNVSASAFCELLLSFGFSRAPSSALFFATFSILYRMSAASWLVG
jgi:hypothetical protein